MFALYVAKKMNRIDKEHYEKLLKILSTLPKKVQETLDMNSAIPALAKNTITRILCFLSVVIRIMR